MPFITTAAAAAEVASVTGVLTAHRAIMFLSVSATSGRANGATRRFLAGLPPRTPRMQTPPCADQQPDLVDQRRHAIGALRR